MKISKENLIKLFRDSITKSRFDMGNEPHMSYNYDKNELNMHYQIMSDYDMIGIVRLYCVHMTHKSFVGHFENISKLEKWQSFGINYFIAFRPYSETTPMRFGGDDDEDRILEFSHELSRDEFVGLALIFKSKLDEVKKIREDESNVQIDRRLEIISDKFGLDFYPKQRKVLIEKFKRQVYGYGMKMSVAL